MITAKEARQKSLDVLEERFKDQLSVVEKYITEACTKGQVGVRIENAEELFPDVDTLAKFLRLRYGYEKSTPHGELILSWWNQL